MSDVGPESESGRIRVRELDVAPVTPQRLKEWLDGGRLEELAAAYPLVDNVRTSRMIVERISAERSPLAAACLIHILSRTTDDQLGNEIRKNLAGFPPDVVLGQLDYSPERRGRQSTVSVYAMLKHEGAVEPLTAALGDGDPEVRATALAGLADMIEASDEWIGHLADTMKSDPHAKVRAVAARALKAIDTPAAFDAFDVASQSAGFDAALLPLLEEMRAARGGGRAAKLKRAAEGAGKAGPLASIGTREIAIAGVVFSVLALVGVFFFSQVRAVTTPTVPFDPGKKRTTAEIEEGRKRESEIFDEVRRRLEAEDGAAAPGTARP